MAKNISKKSAKSAPKKSTKTVSAAKDTAPRKTWADDAKEPKDGNVMAACIALLKRPNGAGIKDFQTVKGFRVSSMTVLRAAERLGYKVSWKKEPGERTVYKATGSAK